MKICYTPRNFSETSLQLIEQANQIISDYEDQGYILTLRQLYYQFVSKDLIPNTVRDYKRLGSVINDGRLAGLISWEAIEDRTRNLSRFSSWASPKDILSAAADGYREDLWRDQPNYIEVWIEKEALAGVFQRVCHEHRVSFFSCRGYVSQSELWGAGRRLAAAAKAGKDIQILHFGDHDPSGIDMTRDIEDRLTLFMGRQASSLLVTRLALNMPQVEQYAPPPNPAKETDSRFRDYQLQFGDESWELDALNPANLSSLVSVAINELRELGDWDEKVQQEENQRERLRKVAQNFRGAE